MGSTGGSINLTAWRILAQIADRWKGYCEDLYCDEEGKETEQEYWEQEPPPLHSEVACTIRQTASRKATGPDESQQNCSKQEERVMDRSDLIFSRPRSEGWPHHGRTFSIYPGPLSF